MSKRTSHEANDTTEERIRQMQCWHWKCGVCGDDHSGSHDWLRPADWAGGVWLCFKCSKKKFVVEKVFTPEKKDDKEDDNDNDKGNNNDIGGGSEGHDNDVVMAT